MLCLPIFESVIKTVLVTAAHCIILHIVVVFCCFYGTVNSTERVITAYVNAFANLKAFQFGSWTK